jgi:hypothetical protein
MEEIIISPVNVTAIANYLLALEQPAIEKSYQSFWQQYKERLKETLESYIHPSYRMRETMIEHFDRSLSHLLENTSLLLQQLTAETKQQLRTYLCRVR